MTRASAMKSNGSQLVARFAFTFGAEMEVEGKDLDVQEVFETWMERDLDSAVAVAAIQALVQVVKLSKANTIMQLGIELKAAADQLKLRNRSSISLTAACELFNRYVTRTLEDIREFELVRSP
jgi:translation initiation factor 2B subunit (eIF-2B alpha/beta/delta family)